MNRTNLSQSSSSLRLLWCCYEIENGGKYMLWWCKWSMILNPNDRIDPFSISRLIYSVLLASSERCRLGLPGEAAEARKPNGRLQGFRWQVRRPNRSHGQGLLNNSYYQLSSIALNHTQVSLYEIFTFFKVCFLGIFSFKTTSTRLGTEALTLHVTS